MKNFQKTTRLLGKATAQACLFTAETVASTLGIIPALASVATGCVKEFSAGFKSRLASQLNEEKG